MASNDPFADIGAAKTAAIDDPFADIVARPSLGKQAVDVVKQIPSGLVTGMESVATFPAQIAGMVAPLANRFLPSDPEAERRQADLRALTAKQRGGGIADYLPKPETPAGEYTRTAAEFVPAALLGSRMAIPRAVGVGATTGLVSEGAGQAAEAVGAGEYAPYARVGGALVAGPMAARLAEGAATRSALKQTYKGVEADANRGFDLFRNAGFTIHPDVGAGFAGQMRADLQATGRTDVVAPKTWKALDNLQQKPFTTPQEFQGAYQELGHIMRSAEPAERAAAGIARERLLGTVENMPPSSMVSQNALTGISPEMAIAEFQKANQNWAALKRAENVSARIEKAEQVASTQHSGLGLENELRRRVATMADPLVTARQGKRGFNEKELAAFTKYGEGGPVQNVRRQVMNYLGGRGGIAATVVGGGGFGLGSYLSGGDPMLGTAYGVGLPLAGLGLAKYGNMRALNNARALELDLLRRSPYAQAAGVPGTRANVPYSMVAPTLATLGDER